MTIHSLTLNWNGSGLLKKMLPGLKSNLEQCGEEYNVLVRDNGSKDDSLQVLSDNSVNVFDIGHNRGSFSEGMNFLFEKSCPKDDDIILLANNDLVFLDNTSLKNMLTVMRRHNASVVGARLTYDGSIISHNGVIFSKKYGCMPWHFREGSYTEKIDLVNRKFQAVTAACAIVNAGMMRKAGCFDENLKWSFDDIDLFLKISKIHNGDVICCGLTNIQHETSVSLKKNPVNKLFMKHNVSYFKKKWSGKYVIDHESYLNDSKFNIV